MILGTATPDVSLYFRAKYEKWPLLELPTRVAAQSTATPSARELQNQLPLPEVEIVDMRAELREGNTSIFSRSLVAGIERSSCKKATGDSAAQPARQRKLCFLPGLRLYA